MLLVDMVPFTRDSLACGGPPRYQICKLGQHPQSDGGIDKRRHDGISDPSSVIRLLKKKTRMVDMWQPTMVGKGPELPPESALCRIQQRDIAAPSAFWIHRK